LATASDKVPPSLVEWTFPWIPQGRQRNWEESAGGKKWKKHRLVRRWGAALIRLGGKARSRVAAAET
jgi:hypothetical protein